MRSKWGTSFPDDRKQAFDKRDNFEPMMMTETMIPTAKLKLCDRRVQ